MKKVLISLLLFSFFITLISCNFSTNVVDEDADSTLRYYATKKCRYIGSAINYIALTHSTDPYVPKYKKILATEFSQITPETSMKMKNCWKSENVIDFSNIDIEAKFAYDNNQKFRGHTLLWYRSIPEWLKNGYDNGIYTKKDIEDLVYSYFEKMFNHFNTKWPNLISSWDVVNEAIGPDKSLYENAEYAIRSPEEDFWVETLGTNYVEKAFFWAHSIDEGAILLYNDFKIGFENSKSKAVYDYIKNLIERNVPINGIGMQYHFDINYLSLDYSWIDFSKKSLSDTIDKFANLGLSIEITELDIKVNSDNNGINQEKLEKQAQLYYDIANIAINKDCVKAISLWGFSDYFTWLNTSTKKEWPLLFDKQFEKKLSYVEFKRAFRECC